MTEQHFFWLHIKKAGGTSTRALLAPDYAKVDWRYRPGSFIQHQPEEYNDLLNNFKTLIGPYQFRRALFAKTYLHPETWDDLCSFAFSREPMERVISMFHYMFWRYQGPTGYVRNLTSQVRGTRSGTFGPRATFDFMLDKIEASRTSEYNHLPLGLHFMTHTARMWQDISDDDGNQLLRYVFRLESMIPAINQVFAECGIERRLPLDSARENVSKRTAALYVPTPTQRARVEALYAEDFELHERALVV